MPPATSAECPCCHECLAPGLDTDRALVIAFLGGAGAAIDRIPPSVALCAHHAKLVGEAVELISKAFDAGRSRAAQAHASKRRS